jgi:hypothetical protein
LRSRRRAGSARCRWGPRGRNLFCETGNGGRPKTAR